MTDARLMVAMAFAGIAGAVTLAALAMLGQQGHEAMSAMRHCLEDYKRCGGLFTLKAQNQA